MKKVHLALWLVVGVVAAFAAAKVVMAQLPPPQPIAGPPLPPPLITPVRPPLISPIIP